MKFKVMSDWQQLQQCTGDQDPGTQFHGACFHGMAGNPDGAPFTVEVGQVLRASQWYCKLGDDHRFCNDFDEEGLLSGLYRFKLKLRYGHQGKSRGGAKVLDKIAVKYAY